MDNPISDHECTAWKSSDLDDVNLEQKPYLISNNNNFGDYLGFYALLSEKANRTSSPEEINNFYCMKKTNYRKEMLAVHLDQNDDIDKGCQVMNEEWRRFNHAHETFNAIDENGK